MFVLFRHSFRTAIFNRFLELAIATSNSINKFYNSGFRPEFSISMSKETIALVRDYVSKKRGQKSKTRGKKCMKTTHPFGIRNRNAIFRLVVLIYFKLFLNYLWWFFCKFVSSFITNQVTSYLCCFLNCSFLSSFKCIYSWLRSEIKKFSIKFT